MSLDIQVQSVGMLVSAVIAGFFIFGLFLSMLSSSPKSEPVATSHDTLPTPKILGI